MIDVKQAGEKIRSRPKDESPSVSGLSPDEAFALLHELRVHQLELEVQNEELRRTHLELEAARARYFDLYDLAPVGYATMNQAGVILEANLTLAGLLGVARGALVEQPFTRFILPADQDVFYRHRRRLIQTGERQVSELRVVPRDGEPSWVKLEATVVNDAGLLVFRTAVSDINARHHAEQTLRASEARHRILFEKSHDALMTLVPPDGRFTSGNSMTVALFGARDQQDLVSRDPSEYSPVRQPDGSISAAAAAAKIETAMQEGSLSYEWTFRRLSGEEFPATVLLTRLEIDGNAFLHATVRDETAAKKLQSMLGQEDRLASMGMLAAGVAHEINNPLANVLYNVETLAEDLPKLAVAVERCVRALRPRLGSESLATVLGDAAGMLQASALKDLVERAEEALGSTQRIRGISRAIGTFARVESTERSRVDLNYSIQCAATMALNDIKFRAKLVTEYAELPAIWASAGKLSQVFLNLLINAAHAVGDGDGQRSLIRVRTWSDEDNVFAEVQDNGKGIAGENLERVFDPFFTTKAAGVGSGLGLAICRNIIEEFEGDISVESELGEGTRFVVRLPIRQGASVAPAASMDSEPAPASSERGRILVVDDEQALRSVIVRMLGSRHEVVTAASAEAARVILEKDSSFDVVLCDLMMPEATGMDLHAWLATDFPALARRVVFMSGGAFTPRASEYLASVDNRNLEKPFDRAQLQELVAEMVETRRSNARVITPV